MRSLAHGIAVGRFLDLPPSAYEIQMLYGMADAEKQAIVELGHRMRIYMPYGELIPGMAYLVRRLLENTSNESFLRASFMEHVPVEQLLVNDCNLDVKNPNSKKDFEHLPPEQLVKSIIQKERRVLEIMEEIERMLTERDA